MAGSFTTVDLSQLAPPDVIEALSYETILALMLADLQTRDPSFTALVESDPAYKVLEVAAYRETLIRQRVNDAARAVMLSSAVGTNLDQLAANFNMERLVLDPGDPDAIPPEPIVYESDSDLRTRVQLALEGITTAGSEGSYVFHALGADAEVQDAQPVSPNPGEVTVYVLSRNGDGTADSGLLAAVDAALNAADVRPLTDQVTVQSAAIIDYAVEAELVMYPGPDAEVVRQRAQDAVTAYVASVRKIGFSVAVSGLYAALHQAGVQSVVITNPASDVAVTDGQAAFCTGITVGIAA
jgi:phage-related baseplate assembly protein